MKILLKAILPIFAVIGLSFAGQPDVMNVGNGQDAPKANEKAEMKEAGLTPLGKKALEFADALGKAKEDWMAFKKQKHDEMFELMRKNYTEHLAMKKAGIKKLLETGKIPDDELRNKLNKKIAFIEKKMESFRKLHEKISARAKKLAESQKAKLAQFKAALSKEEAKQ